VPTFLGSLYQDQVIVVNDNNNNNEVVVTTSKQKKNILYSGIIFIAIVGTTLMIPRYRVHVRRLDEGSLTNLRSATTTDTDKDKCPPCYFPASTISSGSSSVCQQVCYDTKAERGRDLTDWGIGHYKPNWCAGTYVTTKEVLVGKGEFRDACIFITPNYGSSIFDKKW